MMHTEKMMTLKSLARLGDMPCGRILFDRRARQGSKVAEEAGCAALHLPYGARP
jgi:hypothetical protein